VKPSFFDNTRIWGVVIELENRPEKANFSLKS
jgi:hypothetical protein